MIHCVVFDLDGTLVDTGVLFYHLFNAVVSSLGLTPVCFKKLGDPWVSAHGQTLAKYPHLRGVTAEPFFADTWEKVLKEMLSDGGVKLYPGALSILDFLRSSGRKICLASNTPKRFVQMKLDFFEILSLFDAVFTPQDTWGAKPKPESLFHVMKVFGLAPDEIVMLGDLDGDIIYGKNAGVKTIGIKNQYNTREKLTSAGPDWLVEGLSELFQILNAAK